jgi:hypothetical protein
MKRFLLVTAAVVAFAGSANAEMTPKEAEAVLAEARTNFAKTFAVTRDACVQAAEYSSNHGTPKFLNRANAFMELGFDRSNLDIMKLTEHGVKFQGQNGAWVQVNVTCVYNWMTKQVVGINLER